MQEFENKVVVITGGTSGIGLAIARKFYSFGAKVALLGRDSKKLESVQNELKHSLCLQGDVSQVTDLDNFYQKVQHHFGTIDVLIGNAGIAEIRPLDQVDEAFFDKIVNTNYKGLYFTVQKANPLLNEGASVVLISSVAAHLVLPHYSVYGSTKAAVSYLTKSFASELTHRKIRVNSISPGPVDTPMFDDLKKNNPETVDKFASYVPIKRFATAYEIVEATVFLASSKSAYTIGADLVIDGGFGAFLQLESS